MTTNPPDLGLERRVQEVVSSIDATLAADSTIGREGLVQQGVSAALPLLSIDLAGDVDAHGARPSADLQVSGLLGAGGMGAVYAARQRALDRDVAIKRPLSADASDNAQAALTAEGRVMGALEHPNIVPVHALGRDADGLPVLVMKRIEGVSWRDLLREPEHPMWPRLGAGRGGAFAFHIDVLMAVCNALHFAHSRGVVHRDVKPENVMVGAFGEVYLLDWGIALGRGQASSKLVGTPAYMAPEMVLDPASADARTDVYLLGATLHEVLTGQPRHEGTTLHEVFASILIHQPFAYPESVPADLAALCASATDPDRARRPASSAAFRDALAAHLSHRASREIALSSMAKLAAAEDRVRAAPGALEGAEVGVLLAEARFGFEQSLREWPENDLARRSLQRCLEQSVEREIAHHNAAAARAILAAMPSPSASLEARVAELERTIAASRSREEAEAERVRQMDSSVSARARLVGFSIFLLVGVGASIGAYVDEQRTGKLMSMGDQLKIDAVVLAFFVLAHTVGRKRLLTNAFNRATWSIWLVCVLGIAALDVFFWRRGVDAAFATAVDFALFTAVFATAAVTFRRTLAWTALVTFIVAVGSAAYPKVSTLLATMGVFVAISIAVEQSRRSALPAA